MNNKAIDKITEEIIGCCFKVHSELGPGFNEKIYHKALLLALMDKGMRYDTEKVVNVSFERKKVGTLRLDLIVNDKVVVEVKAVTGLLPEIFKYQILSYLKASSISVGLLVNFGNKSCQVKRFVI